MKIVSSKTAKPANPCLSGFFGKTFQTPEMTKKRGESVVMKSHFCHEPQKRLYRNAGLLRINLNFMPVTLQRVFTPGIEQGGRVAWPVKMRLDGGLGMIKVTPVCASYAPNALECLNEIAVLWNFLRIFAQTLHLYQVPGMGWIGYCQRILVFLKCLFDQTHKRSNERVCLFDVANLAGYEFPISSINLRTARNEG